MTATCNNLEEILDNRHELDKEEPDHPATPATTIEWQSGSPMPGHLYDRAVANRRQCQIAEDDWPPMTRPYAISQLKKSQRWLETQQKHKSCTPEDRMVAQNILLGCFDLTRACGVSAADWANRKPKRLRRLRQVKRTWKTKAGSKDLGDLIRLAISSLDAANWLDNETIESDHLPRWTPPKTLNADHVHKLQAGREAQRVEEQARREARLGTFYCESV